jgi:hypothetical protein
VWDISAVFVVHAEMWFIARGIEYNLQQLDTAMFHAYGRSGE